MRHRWQKVDGKCHFCHWWRVVGERRISAMEIIVLLLAIITISALSYRHGADSRNLTDHAAARDSLWSR